MKLFKRPLILMIAVLISGCDIYTSSDRKKFEEDHVAAASTAFATHLQNKSLSTCSAQSLGPSAERTREIGTYSSTDSSSVYVLRQHLIRGIWISEIDNLNGVFCIYE